MAKTLKRLFYVFIVFFFTVFFFIHPAISAESASDDIPLNQYGIRSTSPYVADRFIENEKSIDKIIVPGPPNPPEGVFREHALDLPAPNIAAGINNISNVPAMTWVFGCSATAAAMMFGHYDNRGYVDMYTGSTNGGDFPMTNAAWGTVVINGETRALCPLSATRNGLDGRAIRGHVDDYWVKYGNAEPDPFIGHWTEHTQGECTGDYMGTNQSSLDNTDGTTTFYYYTDGSPLYDYVAPAGHRDGGHGLKLFVESRGYSIQTNGNFNQYIYGHNGNTQGFTFANFKAEINAGRPVLIHLEGHTMLGYGYLDPSTVYVHDTWDYLTHTMRWGGIYADMPHIGVTVLRLADPSADVGIAIAGSPSSVIVGGNVTYTITVKNNGPNGTTNITVTDALPAGVTYVSATPSQGTCSGTGTVTCNPGTINNGSTATISLVVTTTAANAALTNTVSVTSGLTDSTQTNNTATVSTVVNNPAPAIGSLSPSLAAPGGATFTLTVNGSNFVGSSQVKWNGANRTTAFVSATQLTAMIPAADILTEGTANVTVVNPTPGGGTSNAAIFTISTTPLSSGGGGGGCFIATAAFGSPMERHVQTLRDFRDRYLLDYKLGQKFVGFYYQASPRIAMAISKSDTLRFVTRCFLMPFVGIARLTLNLGLMTTLLIVTFAILLLISFFLVLRKTEANPAARNRPSGVQ